MEISKFALAIKVQRFKLGVTQRQAAKASGLSLNAFSKIERGKTSPTLESMLKIANTLNLQMEIIALD